MTVSTQQSIPDRRLDTLLFNSPEGKTRTFTGELPYRMDGLHWTAFVEDTERLRVACPKDHASAKADAVSQRELRSRVDEHRPVEAIGTVDGQQVARGYVDEVFPERPYTIISVVPPW